MDAASAYGRVAVLDWWSTHAWRLLSACPETEGCKDLKQKYAVDYSRLAVSTLDRAVLLWWKGFGLRSYWSAPLKMAMEAGDLRTVLWLDALSKSEGWEMFTSYDFWMALKRPSNKGHLHILDWYRSSGYADRDAFEYEWALVDASGTGTVETLEWWSNSGLLKPDKEKWRISQCICRACMWGMNGRVDVLNWWVASGVKIPCDALFMDSASECGNTSVLQWFKDKSTFSGLSITWSRVAMHRARSIKVLDWWKDSGLECKWDKDDIREYDYLHSPKVKQWWKDFAGI